jgi:hypothetical protein
MQCSPFLLQFNKEKKTKKISKGTQTGNMSNSTTTIPTFQQALIVSIRGHAMSAVLK